MFLTIEDPLPELLSATARLSRQPWTPYTHRYMAPDFKQQVMTLLLARRFESPVLCDMPNELMFEIFGFLALPTWTNGEQYNERRRKKYRKPGRNAGGSSSAAVAVAAAFQ